MIFNQKDDGSCDLEFSQEEIKTISEHKKIHLSAESFKRFGDILVKMIITFQTKFNHLGEKMTYGDDVESEKPKDDI
jgi:hypothetical protein|tara:strand:- start:80 stop:310 length:231 start_codon:yes stop_codon:yes gene_type:complete